MTRAKRPIPKVPQPCVVKLDNKKVDIDKWANQDCPIAFYSTAMTSAEKNYDTSQKELLAFIKAVEHFKQFLYGKEFVIKTDHHPILSITTKSKQSVRFGR